MRGLRSLFTHEKIEDLPEQDGRSARPSLLSWLLASESLPVDQSAPGDAGRSFFGWLSGGERLPEDEPGEELARRRSFLRVLASREELGRDPVAPAGEGCARGGGPAAR